MTSLGGAGGVGQVRERELAASANYFGIQDVEAVDHPYSPSSLEPG